MKKTNGDRTTVILVRHGECRGNREGLFRGRSDFPLNELGLAQARQLALEMKSFRPMRIFTSPLARARQTAQAISEECNVEIEERDGMNNIELGPWEGKSKDDIAVNYPEEWQKWLTEPERLSLPGMELLECVQQRAKKDLEAIVRQYSGQTFIVISHRAVLKPLIAGCLGINPPYFWRIHMDTASYSIMYFKPIHGFTLVQLNQTKHLPEFISEWQ